VLVVTATGANITGTANATGNINAGNLTTAGKVAGGTFAVTGTSNLNAVGNVTITGGTSGQVLTTNGSGVLTWSTASSGSLSNGTSNVRIPVTDGNVNVSVFGTANVLVVTTTGANIKGTVTATGNISAPAYYGPLANGTSNVIMPTVNGNVNTSVGGTANVFVVTTAGANIKGTVTATGNITAANLTTTGKVDTGTLSVTGTSNLNAVGNVTITGGTVGQVLTTNGSGVLTWASPTVSILSNGTSFFNINAVDGPPQIASNGYYIASFGNIDAQTVIYNQLYCQQPANTFALYATSTLQKSQSVSSVLNGVLVVMVSLNQGTIVRSTSTGASDNYTLNIRLSSTITLASVMSNGQVANFTWSVKQLSTVDYLAVVQIDGVAVTVRKSGPVTEASNVQAVYEFTIVKDSTVAGSWIVMQRKTNYTPAV
jgi:hypothetical protein